MNASIGAIADTLIDLHNIDAPDSADAEKERAFNSVLQRLDSLEVFAASIDSATGEHTINVERLLIAIAGIQYYLIDALAEQRSVDPETIRFELRELGAVMDND